MSHVQSISTRIQPEPLPANITSTQPGGGRCYRIELAWGELRRWCLRRLRPGYIRRMGEKRRGSLEGCPIEVLDPRDLKYFRNQCDAHWIDADDPFHWREAIPFARWGLCELLLIGTPLLAAAIALAFTPVWYLTALPAVLLALVVWFFRDPPRRVPQDAGLVVSPADGKLVEITPLAHHDFIGGPAVRIGIFLTIFNVHINRSPCRARVVRLHYSPGKFLNALDPESVLVNENLWIGMEEDEPPYRRIVCRQISGLIARRIVCDLRPGQMVERGEKFGMIKFGSRTELILPAEGLTTNVTVGQWLNAGRDVIGKYAA
ncbi:MAG: phosphatidylserine decarboxylase [Pirellulales bacterium]